MIRKKKKDKSEKDEIKSLFKDLKKKTSIKIKKVQ